MVNGSLIASGKLDYRYLGHFCKVSYVRIVIIMNCQWFLNSGMSQIFRQLDYSRQDCNKYVANVRLDVEKLRN